MQNQPNKMQRDMQQRLNSSGIQPQNVMEQKQIQSQRMPPEGSSTSADSTAQTGQSNGADWQEEAYQKVKAMKEMCLPDLNEMHQKVSLKLQNQDSLLQMSKEQIDWLKVMKAFLERVLTFLQMRRGSIPIAYRDKLSNYEKQIVTFVNTNRGRRPIPSHQGQQQLQPSVGQTLSMTQLQQHDDQKNPQMQPVNISNSAASSMTTMSHSSLPPLSSHLGVQTTQANTITSPLQQDVVGSRQQHTLNASQQTNMNTMAQSGVSTLQPNTNSLQMNGNVLQQLLQSQQMKHHLYQRQMHQQPLQKQQQQQQASQFQTQRMPQLQKMSDDMKMRQGMGFKPGMTPQLPTGTQFPISSPQLLPVASPQMSHSSPQIDQHGLLTGPSKTGTNSPFIVPSPSTPLAPSPIPGDHEKQVSGVSSLSNPGNIGQPPTTTALTQAQSLAIGTPGISASPLLADGNQGTEHPLERLLKAVKSMSPKAFSVSVSDIGSVISMIDRVAGSAPGNGSKAAAGEDLVAMTKCRMQARNFITRDGASATKKMRRDFSAMPLNAVSSAVSNT